MNIIISEKQLKEVLGVNLSYLGAKDGGTNKIAQGSEISSSSKLDDDLSEPSISDRISKSRTPRSYFGARKRHSPINCCQNNGNIISETNQDLVDKQYTLPSHLLKLLKNNSNSTNEKNVNGFQRLNNLINMKSVSTGELYRLRNHFNKLDKDSNEFKLLGGEKMKRWVEQQLNTATSISHNSKVVKKEMGDNNAFIKKHNKTNSGTAHTKKNNISFTYES